MTDPSCLFDPDTRRWFNLALTLDVTINGVPLGPNHLDLAVSRTSILVGPGHSRARRTR